MWWVIIVIFFVGLSLSAATFILQYYGYCPVGPSFPNYWVHASQTARVAARKTEEPGLSNEVLNRLKSFDNVNDIPSQMNAVMDSFTEDGECLICQEAMQSAKISQLPCGHIYHKACVSKWLRRKPTCPSCRTAITEENINGFPDSHRIAPDIEMGMAKT